jgi:two-component system, NtrC family, response regulator AtoC
MLPERKPQILVVDDEVNLRRVLSAQLMRDGYDVHVAVDGEDGLAVLAEHHIDLVITDLRMPRLDGMGFLREALRGEPELPVVMITAHGTVDTAVEALKSGAFDYITKPFDQAEVRAVVRKALESRRLSERDPRRAVVLDEEPLRHVAGGDAALNLLAALDRVAASEVTVLICGERGTGKELVAREIHRRSARASRPFIKVSCAALDPAAVEAELLGTEPQVGPTAVQSKPGRFELAAGGVLFLDDVPAIPLHLQVRLGEVLARGSFERVGGVRSIPVDFRVIATTQFDLRPLVVAGAFSGQLLAALGSAVLQLEPLRDRTAELANLAQSFVAKYNRRFGKRVEGLSESAIASLGSHPWPGNLRELENVMERAVLVCDGNTVQPSDLPLEIANPSVGLVGDASAQGLRAQVKEATIRLERDLINRALLQTHGNVTHAARILKISRKGLQLKMKELGLRERDDRIG